AALAGIPALMIDPKGDISNALLHFPDLLPQDFAPWLNPDLARRAGQSLDQAAAQAAAAWKAGLAEWEIGPERLRALQNAAHFAIYTPGSDAGIPVSILASFQAPPIPWDSNRELLREKISGTVTALLGLVGLQNIDPVRSREHILLSNIFENAWKQSKDLDLGELILQTQTPPFPKLGVFDVNTFFPEKDRFELAMLLNNILAAPTFQAWIEGQPLDVQSLLYAPDGRPRHSVFYIAHLSDAERMFFVTLLYSAVESWMRTQTGTPALRAILYFDEIFGYLPPVENPPSKQPMLRMLKQARAFGVGQLLVTQNPVDLDYKALSNAGSWFIGKLQTDQDKQRLLDGLQGALGGSLDRGMYDRLISALGKRVFLAHNIHQSASPAPAAEGDQAQAGAQLFQTRWTMNYLAGPLTRAQIPALNQLVGAEWQPAIDDSQAAAGGSQPAVEDVPPAANAPSTAAALSAVTPLQPTNHLTNQQTNHLTNQQTNQPPNQLTNHLPSPQSSTTRPAVPTGVTEYFLPNNQTLSQALLAAGRPFPENARGLGLVYRPALLAQSSVRYLNRKYGLDYEQFFTALVSTPDRRGVVRWETCLVNRLDPQALNGQPDPQARYAALEAPLSDAKALAALQKDFLDWAYRTSRVSVRTNDALGVFAGPEVSQAAFRTRCANAARQGRDAEAKKAAEGYKKKIEALQLKQAREERELSADQTQLSQRKWEEFGTGVENAFSLLGGRRSSRRISSSLSKHRLTEKAKADVEESQDSISDFKGQIAELEQEMAQALNEINTRWGELANQVSDIPITPLKKDVLLDLFGVAWLPHHLIQVGNERIELPGYEF
ncbi:MAG TPA: hypothetical protein VF823_02075, partial [Anaerolineales bacterium]